MHPRYSRLDSRADPTSHATFDVTLVVPKEQTALSNMPVKAESEEGGLKVRTRLLETRKPKPETLNKAESEEGGLKVRTRLQLY